MLVLDRKQQQAIAINGQEILIKVISVNGNRVKIGIDAPDAFAIARTEILPPLVQAQIEQRLTPHSNAKTA